VHRPITGVSNMCFEF